MGLGCKSWLLLGRILRVVRLMDLLQASRVRGENPSSHIVLVRILTDVLLLRPKRRTYAELDVLFQAKIPARQFASTDVAALNSTLYHTTVPDQQPEKDVCEMVEHLDKS